MAHENTRRHNVVIVVVVLDSRVMDAPITGLPYYACDLGESVANLGFWSGSKVATCLFPP